MWGCLRGYTGHTNTSLPGTESEVPLAEKSQGIQTSNYELDSDVFSVLKQLWGFHGVSETCDFPRISKEENSPCKAAPQHSTATTSDPKKTAGMILQKTHSSQHSCNAAWWWAPRWWWSTANRKGSVSAHLRFNFPFFTLLATKHCGSGTLGEALQRGMNNISCLPSPDCCLLDFKWAHPTQQLSHKIQLRLFGIVIITFLLLNFQTCSLGPIPCSCEKRQMKWKAVTILRWNWASEKSQTIQTRNPHPIPSAVRPLPRHEFCANRHKIITLHSVSYTWSSKTLSVKWWWQHKDGRNTEILGFLFHIIDYPILTHFD